MNKHSITRSGSDGTLPGPTSTHIDVEATSQGQGRRPLEWVETRLVFRLGDEFVGLRQEIPATAPRVDWESFLNLKVVPILGQRFRVLHGEEFSENIENGEVVRESIREVRVVHPISAELDSRFEQLCRCWRVDFNLPVVSMLRVRVGVFGS